MNSRGYWPPSRSESWRWRYTVGSRRRRRRSSRSRHLINSLTQERREVEDAIKAIERIPGNNTVPHDARAEVEVEVYHKAGVWALREGYIPKDYAFILPLKGVDFRLVLR